MKSHEKQEKNRKRDSVILWLIAALIVLIIAAVIVLCVVQMSRNAAEPSQTESTQTEPTQEIEPLRFDIPGFTRIDEAELTSLNAPLKVTAVGRYTGPYVEDGTDEEVTDVLALIVENTGESWVEYAELTMDCGGQTARFVLSVLPAGSSALLMETNRMTYVPGTPYRTKGEAKIADLGDRVMDFSGEFVLYPDDGVINVENVSGADHPEIVAVCYKNYLYGLYIGGICYRARFESGIAAGEIVQSIQPHYTNADSVILFMSYES